MGSDKNVVYSGRFYDFVVENGWEYLRPSGFDDVVVIVPVTNSGMLVLVEQYRVPAERKVIELPAGLVGDLDEYGGENIVETARRELVEETGYSADRFEIVADSPPSAGSNTLSVKMVLATGLEKTGPGGGVKGESIQVHEIPAREGTERLARFRDEGFAVDLKIYAGLWFARNVISTS